MSRLFSLSLRAVIVGFVALALVSGVQAKPTAKQSLALKKQVKVQFQHFVRDARKLRRLIKKARAHRKKQKKARLALHRWTHVAVSHKKKPGYRQRKKQLTNKVKQLRRQHKAMAQNARKLRRKLRRRRRRIRQMIKKHRSLQGTLKKWVKGTNKGKKDKEVPLTALLDETESASLSQDNPIFNDQPGASTNIISQ